MKVILINYTMMHVRGMKNCLDIGPEEFLWADQTGLESHAVPSAFGKFYEAALEALAKEE